jgi:hypothetical protein
MQSNCAETWQISIGHVCGCDIPFIDQQALVNSNVLIFLAFSHSFNFIFCYIFNFSLVNGRIFRRRLLISFLSKLFNDHGWEHYGNQRENFRG